MKVLAGENEGAKEYIAQLEFRFVKQEEVILYSEKEAHSCRI